MVKEINIADSPILVQHLQIDRIKEIKKYYSTEKNLLNLDVDLINLLEKAGIPYTNLRATSTITICVLYRSLFQNRKIEGSSEMIRINSKTAFSESFWKSWEKIHNEILSFVDGSFAHQDTTATIEISVRGEKKKGKMRGIYEKYIEVDFPTSWNTYPNILSHNLDEALADMHTILKKLLNKA